MKIDLTEIYKGLKAWRHEHKITVESQKKDYLVNVMREFGKLSQALRDYEKIKNGERAIRAGIFDIKSTLGEMTIFEGTTKGELEISLEKVEHEIIDALCNISVFTINAGTDIPCSVKRTEIELKKSSLDTDYILKQLVERCAGFSYFESWGEASAFNIILANCAYLCEQYGYNFQQAMLENIKEISSRTGSYDEKAKKFVKADYEKSKDKAMIKYFENGNKEKLKLVLEEVYKQNTEQMSDDELVFCYIAKTLKSLENFCELAESGYLELASRILKIEKTLKHANTFDEFKVFCLEDCYDIGKYANAAGCTPKEPVNTENKTPKEEPTEVVKVDADKMHFTADRLAEFNLEAYKEEVEADVNRARRALYGD